MGIKNFSKTFNAVRTVKYKDLRGKTIAIDAMTELYRAALGAKTVATLTDKYGKPTMHISVILSIVIELQLNDVNQIWVFDYDQDPNTDFHNPMKLGELAKRKKRKDIAIESIKSIADLVDDSPMFSDDEDADEAKPISEQADIVELHKEPTMPKVLLTEEEETKLFTMTYRQKAQFMLKKTETLRKEYEQQLADYNHAKNKKNRIASLEKQTFSVSKDMINDVKLILNCLNIKFIESPRGFEGEAITSYLTQIGQADAVFSGDTDPIAYGATVLLRRNPRDKLIYEYTQQDILDQIRAANSKYKSPTLADLHKVAMALGTDACEKTPGIGPGTVLKKLHEIELTPAQIAAMKEFVKIPEMSEIKTYNADLEPFIECKTETLIDWLVNERSFTRTRIQAQMNKVIDSQANTQEPAKLIVRVKPSSKAKILDRSRSRSRSRSKSPIAKQPIAKQPIIRRVVHK
jgi:hypothetical protein